jgi:hypothetical protein
MSQRIIHHGTIEALAGWDRPLGHFFLAIEDTSQDDGCIFTNLSRRNPGMTLAEIRTELDKAKIPIPPGLFAELENDRRQNVGNEISHYYHDQGKWRVEGCSA